eukprot:403351078
MIEQQQNTVLSAYENNVNPSNNGNGEVASKLPSLVQQQQIARYSESLSQNFDDHSAISRDQNQRLVNDSYQSQKNNSILSRYNNPQSNQLEAIPSEKSILPEININHQDVNIQKPDPYGGITNNSTHNYSFINKRNSTITVNNTEDNYSNRNKFVGQNNNNFSGNGPSRSGQFNVNVKYKRIQSKNNMPNQHDNNALQKPLPSHNLFQNKSINYGSSLRNNKLSLFMEQSDNFDMNNNQNIDKSIEISDYLSRKIDTKKLNVQIFQNKIKKFQTQYGLKLIDPKKEQPKNVQNSQQQQLRQLNNESGLQMDTIISQVDLSAQDSSGNLQQQMLVANNSSQQKQVGGSPLPSQKYDFQTIDERQDNSQEYMSLRNYHQQAKKKHMHNNGLEFYRIRMGINDLPKIRFEKSEPPGNVPSIRKQMPNFKQLHKKIKEERQTSYLASMRQQQNHTAIDGSQSRNHDENEKISNINLSNQGSIYSQANQVSQTLTSGSNLIFSLAQSKKLEQIENEVRQCLLEIVQVGSESNQTLQNSVEASENTQQLPKNHTRDSSISNLHLHIENQTPTQTPPISQQKQSSQSRPITNQVVDAHNNGTLQEKTVFIPILKLHQNHPLFSKLSPQSTRILLQFGQIITLVPNQILYKQGSVGKKIYFVFYGQLCYQLNNINLEQSSSVCFGIGSVVGEEWLFNQKNFKVRNENCYAKVNTCVLELTQRQFESLKEFMNENLLKKDLVLLESIIKRNYIQKKSFYQQ